MEYHSKIWLQPLVARLETITNERYSNSEYATRIGINRQLWRALVAGADVSSIKYAHIDKLLKYFNDNGLHVTVGDLFSVTKD